MLRSAIPMTTRLDNELYVLARNLLAPASIEELLAQAPAWLAPTFGPGAEIRVVLGAEAGQDEPGPAHGAVVRLPLQAGEQTLGTLIASVPEGQRWDAAHAAAAADLLAIAIAREQRAVAERQRGTTDAATLKSDLIAILSHEMRTPLAAIKGSASALLLDDVGWDEATRHELLRAIDEESDRLTKLIGDILDSSAIDAGGLRIDPEPLLLPRLVQRAVEKVRLRTDRHRFVLSFPREFPIVYADEQRIDQVLSNLLDNAIKYSPDGGLVVVRGQIRPDEVVVSVADQGIGIAPEHLSKLFERYFRAGTGRRPGVVGTGLGLPISDAIIRAHGGRIWAESTLGRGTTLSFTLPTTAPPGASHPEVG